MGKMFDFLQQSDAAGNDVTDEADWAPWADSPYNMAMALMEEGAPEVSVEIAQGLGFVGLTQAGIGFEPIITIAGSSEETVND